MRNNTIKFLVLVFVISINTCKTDKSNTKDDDYSKKESLYSNFYRILMKK